jgi:cell division protein FtsI (penicillin-binding protein 3)
MDARQTILLRTRLAFLGLFTFGLATIGKLIHIQFFQGKKWEQLAQKATLAFRPIQPSRGNIYAQDGSLLATSLPFYEVAMDPCIADNTLFRDHIAALSSQLASFYHDKSPQAYQSLITQARKNKKRYLLLNNKQISYHEKKHMSQWPIFREGRFRGGVLFKKAEKRFKPFQELGARTIGFINKGGEGVGLEWSFDKDLRGIPGKALYQKLTGGNWKMIPSSNTKNPIHGYDLITTLDIHLQDVAHTSLLKVLQQSQANYGSVIVMEVSTGEIKAMVNLGKVAPNQYHEVYNYAVGSHGTTEPGSSFKLVSMLALLEETNLQPTDTIDTGDGKFKFYGLTMHDTKADGYGVLTVQEVFEKSSNIGVAKLIDSVFSQKPERFIQYIRQLGLHKPLGMQLQGEGVPFIKQPKQSGWTKVTIPWMAMGYELKLSPLQILTLYNAVANQGTMIQPILVKEIKQANKTIQTFKTHVLRSKICSESTLSKLKIMLEGVVERGTASKFRHGFYKMAGKSGTTNKLENGRYGNATYASFVGYFPADKPRYSCMVVIDDPKGAAFHFGGQVAAPVVKEIADRLAAKDLVSATCLSAIAAKKMPILPPVGRVVHQQDWLATIKRLKLPLPQPGTNEGERWMQVTRQGKSWTWKAQDTFTSSQVPYVIGMNLKDALFVLENRGIQVRTQGPGSGYVRSQSILPGTPIHYPFTITLELS